MEKLSDKCAKCCRICNLLPKPETGVKPVGYFSLFKYSTVSERFCIGLAIILALISGTVPPIINILYGEYCNLMIDRQFPKEDTPSTKMNLLPVFGGGRVLHNATLKERQAALREDSYAWGVGCGSVSLVLFFFSMASVFLSCLTSNRQISRIKILFFKSIVCKDLSWFDINMKGNSAGEYSENLILIERGISDVLSVFTLHLAIGLINIGISFMYGWLLALTLLVVISPIVVCAFYTAKLQTKLSVEEMHAFTRAGNIAEEVFSSIKTVIAFEGESKEIARYSEFLSQSKKCEIKRSVLSGISNGLLWFIIYCAYSVAFVLGVRLIETSKINGDHQYTPGVLLIIFFGIITAMMSLGYATGRLGTFTVACAAAGVVYDVINTKSLINPCEGGGDKNPECQGEIEFKHVYFEYPSRAGNMTLKGLNLKIKAGETVAIVGESGTGKSTILNLVQRLYDPSKGMVLLDGQDLKSLDVAWLREQLGVLEEEAVLFSASIRENIWYGNLKSTDEDIKQAAISAGANDFVMELKEGFNTEVGQQGFKLSGGQRQRIAVARVLVRKPKILILDEVTAALDAASESALQDTLTKAAVGRTTLIVTHRLSTIVHVDRIIVLANGVVVEEGTHHELFRANGIYKHLFENQLGNIRDRRRTVKIASQVVYQEAPVLPPGPRGRFNSITGVPRSVKSEGALAGEPTRKLAFPEIFRWTRPELTFYLIGFLASIISGAALPVVCVLFGDIFGFLALTDFTFIKSQTDVYAAILVAVGVTAGVCVYVQMYCFGTASVRLSTRLRIRAFKAMVQQDVSFFDDEKNTVAALCFRLKEDASGVQRTFDIRLGVLMQAISTMTIGLVLSFVYNVKITLVTMATIPFLFSGVYIESVFATGTWTSEGKAMEKAAKIAVEVMGNIKLVASLTRETLFINKYAEAVKEGTRSSGERYWLRSFAFAMGQSAPFFGYAVTLWYGGRLIAEENVPYKYVIKISELLIFGTWTLGQSMVLGPNIGEARSSAGRLNYLFTRTSRVPDGYSELPGDKTTRTIVFSKVHFAYPGRTSTMAIQNFSLRIEPGKTVAIMGASGSGKSTIFHLLLRFYDPLSGSIAISKSNIRGYKLSSLRRIFGLVSQKADLFDRTIQENIAYGDNSRAVSFQEVTEAAKAANIHSFIQTLPLGYETMLGTGSQLSGGQKQRIAIARVLVRNPDILLLDEATSALDPENESLVQNALDIASVGRTTLTIAHRFSAVKKADIIYVLEKGMIKEFGTRQELTLLRGLFYAMQNYKAELDQEPEEEDRNNSETSET